MILQMSAIDKRFSGPDGMVLALASISLSVEAGELTVVEGPSGCGKSTLLLAAGGLLAPDRGQVRVDDQDLYALNPERRARFRARNIGFVFQQFHLIPYLSVLDNVLAPSMALPRPEAEDRALQLIEALGLSARRRHFPPALSTGERQRTALARALLNRPRLLLADEPTGNLDPQNTDAVFAHLAEFARAGGAVLVVTHDAQAARHAGRVVALRDGRLVDDRNHQTPQPEEDDQNQRSMP